eukprot:CAMPEP_0178464916 /NCGR_PEP_ID=MMETSP0689_2-20121128/51085_1 /TAXON_ID=160604 /ORGANISM="Amphidinium massartii, Strain CS-259" /LENGTH=56 /DNA_ID=CAMNT_0020091825 /DNA_START=326 /DNA_END=496 /DNA_ORIENTATION=-
MEVSSVCQPIVSCQNEGGGTGGASSPCCFSCGCSSSLDALWNVSSMSFNTAGEILS